MPIRVKIPLVKMFRLEKSDAAYEIADEDATTVTIKQASGRENGIRQGIMNKVTYRLQSTDDAGGTAMQINWTPYEIIQVSTMLTLVDSNLEDPEGKPLFRFKSRPNGVKYLDMTNKDFLEAWGSLGQEVQFEIYEKVLEVNPHWLFASDQDGGISDLGEDV